MRIDNTTLVIWGIGYLGFSNLIYYSKKSIPCVGIDIDPDIKENIILGRHKIDLLQWMRFDGNIILNEDTCDIITDIRRLIGKKDLAHIICVPTENNGAPWDAALFDVANKIIEIEKNKAEVAVLIESTMTPGTAKRILDLLQNALPNSEILLCVSPRRDWFTRVDKSIQNLTRVYGANTKKSADFFEKILSVICKNLIRATCYQYAEMCKSVENSLRHISILLADQLADAFPEIDIREVLALAGTKWNIDHYRPSFGPGGYCIPLSSKYLLQAAAGREIPVLRETVQYAEKRLREIATFISDHIRGCKIGILGITYEADIRVDTESPILGIMEHLKRSGHEIFVHDPYYSNEEIATRYRCLPFQPEPSSSIWSNLDAVIVNTPHTYYQKLNVPVLIRQLKFGIEIFDNTGIWEQYSGFIGERGNYRLIGAPSWNA